MKLSLSVRVAESFSNKRVVDIELPDLVVIARDAGYEALCMRASMVGTHSPAERVKEVHEILSANALPVSMVTADFAVPENKSEGPACLRNITPHLDLAEALACDLIRVCIKEHLDIPFARRSADEAAERGIRLAHQSHTQSMFETVEGTLEVLDRIDNPNFGLIYEPANLALCGEDYGPDAIRRFSSHLFNVYLQNHTPDPEGDRPMETFSRGRVMSSLHPFESQDGIDFESVFRGLRGIGYDGYVTVHHAFGGSVAPEDAAMNSARFLLCQIESGN